MQNLHFKVKAIRLLRHLTQENAAQKACFHIKTYQRKESGISPIAEQDLFLLSIAFNCTADDIRNFDLENNRFSKEEDPPSQRLLEIENNRLKSEVFYLRQLLDKLAVSFLNTRKQDTEGSYDQVSQSSGIHRPL